MTPRLSAERMPSAPPTHLTSLPGFMLRLRVGFTPAFVFYFFFALVAVWRDFIASYAWQLLYFDFGFNCAFRFDSDSDSGCVAVALWLWHIKRFINLFKFKSCGHSTLFGTAFAPRSAHFLLIAHKFMRCNVSAPLIGGCLLFVACNSNSSL